MEKLASLKQVHLGGELPATRVHPFGTHCPFVFKYTLHCVLVTISCNNKAKMWHNLFHSFINFHTRFCLGEGRTQWWRNLFQIGGAQVHVNKDFRASANRECKEISTLFENMLCRLLLYLCLNSTFHLQVEQRGYLFPLLANSVLFRPHFRRADEAAAALNSCHLKFLGCEFRELSEQARHQAAKVFLTSLSVRTSCFIWQHFLDLHVCVGRRPCRIFQTSVADHQVWSVDSSAPLTRTSNTIWNIGIGWW